MRKRVLIISPYFPPTNAADMQRIRMSLPYYKELGWDAEVVAVDPAYSDIATDSLLIETVPDYIPVHLVKALSKSWTAKIGLGSIAIRSLLFYKKTVNTLLKEKKFDLIFFSTTQFPVCILGAYWKKKYKIPYLIDMQDPWHSEYYQDKPKEQRPAKYWFSYRLNKYLEPIAMKGVDGLISVSQAYLTNLSERYTACSKVPQQTITFGAFDKDLEIAQQHLHIYPSILPPKKEQVNIVYIGRGGHDMKEAVSFLFKAFKQCLTEEPDLFAPFHFYFIGTSYAADGKGIGTIAPLATEIGIDDFVTEITDRIPFYQTLNTLADATALFIPGSNDPQYTASKIYPYVMVKKPLLALFHSQSNAVAFLKNCEVGTVLTFDKDQQENIKCIKAFCYKIANKEFFSTEPNKNVFKEYTAEAMTKKQCALFNEVVG